MNILVLWISLLAVVPLKAGWDWFTLDLAAPVSDS